ncbi:MAG: mechanosensitive ion channel family protein, partial [Anaerolineae bacterium]|nr:mechanosensitive ion channel family protein [Anaerolineae bacterium]
MNIDQAMQALLVRALQFVPNLVVALLTFLAGLLLAGPAARGVRRALALRIREAGLLDLLAKLVRWAVIVTGLVVALEQVSFNVTGFVAGLGIAGLTIGFALQDIARNFVAGILLMIRQPFAIGDDVSVAGFAGAVVAVNTRDTVIRTWDGELTIVPNTKVFENPITNYTRSQQRMRTIRVILNRGQDTAS